MLTSTAKVRLPCLFRFVKRSVHQFEKDTEAYLMNKAHELNQREQEHAKRRKEHVSCEEYFAGPQRVDRDQERKSKMHSDNYVGHIGNVGIEATNMVSTFGKPCDGQDLTGKAVGFYDSPLKDVEMYKNMVYDQEAYDQRKREMAIEAGKIVSTGSGYSRRYARTFSKIDWNSEDDSDDDD